MTARNASELRSMRHPSCGVQLIHGFLADLDKLYMVQVLVRRAGRRLAEESSMTRPITTVLPVGTARQVPPPAFVELARYVEASGHVDCIWNYDQLVSFLPKC